MWTRCVDMLPTLAGDYLCWCDGDYCVINHWENGWDVYNGNRDYEKHNVVAWMSIPKYREGQNDDTARV